MMLEKILHLKKLVNNNSLVLHLNLVDLELHRETERWKESSKLSMEKSEQCLMHRESMVRFDMDFGQNVHLQHLSMRTES